MKPLRHDDTGGNPLRGGRRPSERARSARTGPANDRVRIGKSRTVRRALQSCLFGNRPQWRKATARTVIMGAFIAASAVAQESPPTEWEAARLQFDGQVEMFNLYTHCRPLYINATVNEEAEGIGVSPDGVHAAVEGRLRSEGLYQPEFVFPSLGVKVNVVGDAFRIDVELQRLVFNLIQEPTVNNALLREMDGGPLGRTVSGARRTPRSGAASSVLWRGHHMDARIPRHARGRRVQGP